MSPLSFSLEDQNFATFTESGLVAVGLVCQRLIATAMIAWDQFLVNEMNGFDGAVELPAGCCLILKEETRVTLSLLNERILNQPNHQTMFFFF